jgi:hypothetical protein
MSKSGVYTDKEISIYHSTSFKYVTGLQISNCMGNINIGKEKYNRKEIYTIDVQVPDQIAPVNISPIFSKVVSTLNPPHTKSPPHWSISPQHVFVVNNNSYDYITIIIGFDNDILKSNNWDTSNIYIIDNKNYSACNRKRYCLILSDKVKLFICVLVIKDFFVKYRLIIYRVDTCKLMLTCVCMNMDSNKLK